MPWISRRRLAELYTDRQEHEYCAHVIDGLRDSADTLAAERDSALRISEVACKAHSDAREDLSRERRRVATLQRQLDDVKRADA